MTADQVNQIETIDVNFGEAAAFLTFDEETLEFNADGAALTEEFSSYQTIIEVSIAYA